MADSPPRRQPWVSPPSSRRVAACKEQPGRSRAMMTQSGSAPLAPLAAVCAYGALGALPLAAAGCGGSSPSSSQPVSGTAAATVRIGRAPGETYPAPRWPSYFKPAKSIDDLMPAARALVRNQSGLQGKGMGILQPGESVLI